MIERSVVGERLVGDVCHEDAVMADAEARLRFDCADDYTVEAPLFEDSEDFVFAALDGDLDGAVNASAAIADCRDTLRVLGQYDA